MIEATTNPDARTAMERAHLARSDAAAAMWSWLFARSPR